MLEGSAQAQAEALGILGVNLVHGALTRSGNYRDIINHLMDDLDRSRVEVQPADAAEALATLCMNACTMWRRPSSAYSDIHPVGSE